MMRQGLDDHKLRQSLEILFHEMQKKGILPPQINNKEQLIDNVFQVLRDPKNDIQLTPDSLRDPNIRKALCLALIAETICDKHPDLSFNFIKLFAKKFEPNDAEKELKKELKLLLIKLNELNPDPKKRLSEKDIDDLVNKLAKKMTASAAKTDRMAESKLLVDTLSDVFTEALRNLYGGIDPRVTGGTVMPVLNIIGNLAGIVDYNGDNELSNAFIDTQARFDMKPDPTGIKNSVRTRLDAISDTLETELESIGALSNSPKIKRG